MNFETAVSRDGTRIAYETRGNGPPVIMIGGANNTRHSPPICALPMAELLAPQFRAIAFDRRGRGDSGDTPPHAVAREVEDVAAIIAAVGGPVRMFGHSSGGALILECALAGLPISAIAIYEPPYAMDEAAESEGRRWDAEIGALLAAGKPGAAAEFFMAGTGMPRGMIEGMKGSPYWPAIERLAPTLPYENRIMAAAGSREVREKRLAAVGVSVLAMAGGDSPDWMRAAARSVAEAVPKGTYREFAGANHMVGEALVAPVLVEFFRGK
jgi:pimeloyl-ACP methyl ester carboxylesterase